MQGSPEKTSEKHKERATHTHHAQQQDPRRQIEVDQDGFQKVKSKWGIRQNIFEHNEERVQTNGLNQGNKGADKHAPVTGVAATTATEQNNRRNQINADTEKTQAKQMCNVALGGNEEAGANCAETKEGAAKEKIFNQQLDNLMIELGLVDSQGEGEFEMRPTDALAVGKAKPLKITSPHNNGSTKETEAT